MRKIIVSVVIIVAAYVFAPAAFADLSPIIPPEATPEATCPSFEPCNAGSQTGTCVGTVCCIGCVIRDVTGMPIACFPNGWRTTTGYSLCGVAGAVCVACTSSCDASGHCV